MAPAFQISAGPAGWKCHIFDSRQANGLLAWAQVDDLFVALLGRLYYKNDLNAVPNIAGQPPASDAELVARLYQTAGEAALTKLEGDFSLAVIDLARDRLLALRDPFGGYPIYWIERGDELHLGNSLSRLAALQASREISGDYVAEFLAMQSYGEQEPVCEETIYRGVRRLLPGVLLTHRRGELQPRRVACWNWLDRRVDPGTDALPRIAEVYRDTLRSAVRHRMEGRLAAQLSGGMDSTSVTMLALGCLAETSHCDSIAALSLVYREMRMLAPERSVIENLAASDERLRPMPICGDELSDFQLFAAAPPHDEPWPWLSAAHLESAMMDAAAQFGAATILTGQGADELLDTGPFQVADLLRRGRLLRAIGEARQSARAENVGLWSILLPFGVVPLLPAAWRDGLRPLAPRRATFRQLRRNDVPPWILPEFACRFHLRDRLLARSRAMFSACRPVALSVALNSLRGRHGDLGRWYLGLPRGIHLARPFLDPGVW